MKTTSRTGQSGKSIEEVVSYAVGHRIRIQVLSILSEGVYSVDQVAEIMDEEPKKVAHHIGELADAGSIEVAKIERVHGNLLQHFYRAVELPYYSEEKFAALTPKDRQVHLGLALQTIFAEAMAAFWAGKMSSDPKVCVVSNWLNVDEQGREEIADEQERSWNRLCEIEEASINRCAPEESRSVMVGQLGYFRQRKGPRPSDSKC